MTRGLPSETTGRNPLSATGSLEVGRDKSEKVDRNKAIYVGAEPQ